MDLWRRFCITDSSGFEDAPRAPFFGRVAGDGGLILPPRFLDGV